MKILSIVILMITLLLVKLVASEDLWFENTDTKAGLCFGSEIEEYGFQFGTMSHFTDTNHRLGGELVWWFVDDKSFERRTKAEINFNYHYILIDEGWLKCYPLISVGYHFHYEEWRTHEGRFNRNNSEVAFGIGGGVEFGLPQVDRYQMERLRIYVEPRYFVSGIEQLQMSVGVYIGYPF